METKQLEQLNDLDFSKYCYENNINSIDQLQNGGLKLKALKTGFGKHYIKWLKNTPEQRELNKMIRKCSDKDLFYVNTIDEFFTFSESEVRNAMILMNIREYRCKKTGKLLKEGLIVKKEPYIHVYTFNIIASEIIVDMGENEMFGEQFGFIVRVNKFPTVEQLTKLVLTLDSHPFEEKIISDSGKKRKIYLI